MDKLHDILKLGYSKNASDIHFKSAEPVWFRIDGQIFPQNQTLLSHEELFPFLEGLIPAEKQPVFKSGKEVDFAYEIPELVRFRVNVYQDLQGISACFRVLPSEIKTVNDLKMEQSILDLCTRNKGLILVTGPTGSGKSTTLASLMDYVNILHNGHIITIEDPVEFVFKEKNCLINQREISTHTQSFSKALRATLREDPNVVMVGEMRDLETTMTALEIAETGHLVFSTLHTNSAASTVYRIINQFPRKKQDQIRLSLAASLVGVISQTLVPCLSGHGRVAVREVMIVNHAVANLIRENKIYQISNVIQMSRNAGMITMSDAMMDLITRKVISPVAAIEKVNDQKQLEQALKQRGIF